VISITNAQKLMAQLVTDATRKLFGLHRASEWSPAMEAVLFDLKWQVRHAAPGDPILEAYPKIQTRRPRTFGKIKKPFGMSRSSMKMTLSSPWPRKI